MATTHPEHEKDSVPFFPNHFMTELYVVIGLYPGTAARWLSPTIPLKSF